MLPLSYAVRNLFRAPARLVQLVSGATAVVSLIMLASAFSNGMSGLLAASGSLRNVILLGAGSEESVERSEIPPATPGIAAAAIPGLKTVLGAPAVSPEIHFNAPVSAADAPARQGLVRGVTTAALAVHPEVQIVEGRFPRSGEIMAGAFAARKLGVPPEGLAVGKTVVIDGVELTVAGRFAAPGTVMEAELWASLSDVRAIAQRETLSCVVVRLGEEGTFEDAEIFALQRLDLELVAMRESDYYAKLSAFYAPLRIMTWLTAGLVAAGAVFGGLNTLHAAFATRVREMATLQAMGYGRPALLTSILQESLLATLCGALLAAAAAAVLGQNIVVPFSIGAFRLDMSLEVLGAGILAGVLLGIAGAIAPAWVCLQPELREALRAG